MKKFIDSCLQGLGGIITICSFVSSIITIYMFFSEQHVAFPTGVLWNFFVFFAIGFLFSFIGYYSRAYNRRDGGGVLMIAIGLISGVVCDLLTICLRYLFSSEKGLMYAGSLVILASISAFATFKIMHRLT